ncbi:hypothetical protein Q1695_016053 [Nippostrongylus brasiliensis]|nr:hypothetical protein Q1695_016053 [Nippostrongylus brasiliensis]
MKAQMLPFILALAATTCSGGKACSCGHGHRLFSPPAPPPFMKNVSTEAQMELISVFANETMTIAEQKKAIRIWGKEHGIQVGDAFTRRDIRGQINADPLTTFYFYAFSLQKQVEDFEANTKERRDRLKRNVAHILFKHAKLALERFTHIMFDDEVTWSERKSKLKQLEAEHPEAVEVLKVAFEQPLIEGIDQHRNQWYRDYRGEWRIRISD